MEINDKLAPIVLFVYNRPDHTLQTLEALLNNPLASASILYIFADGPKADTSGIVLKSIEETRKVIRKKKWCGEVIINESSENKGLAKSIVEGVTQAIDKHNKVIVLEDDIVTSPGFLKYMNDALEVYEKEEQVMHISAYFPPVKNSQVLPETFFYSQASCWGWATWKRAWNHYNGDAQYLLKRVTEEKLEYFFNVDNTYPFIRHLQANVNGTKHTWAIKWHASILLKKGLCLHPRKSLVTNIGFDGTGENCGDTEKKYEQQEIARTISIHKLPLADDKKARELVKRYNRKQRKSKSTTKKMIKKILWKLKAQLQVITK